MRRCFIFGAASISGLPVMPTKEDFVIAADGGLKNTDRLGIKPDLILGDFDSLGQTPVGDNVIIHPVEKDVTDMALAVSEGINRGYNTFYLYGGVGGDRLDHTLANIQIVTHCAQSGITCFLIGEGNVITAVKNRSVKFNAACSGILSVFCSGRKATGVYLENLKYPLYNATLNCTVPLGISNSFLGKPSTVKVKNGTLILLFDEKNLKGYSDFK